MNTDTIEKEVVLENFLNTNRPELLGINPRSPEYAAINISDPDWRLVHEASIFIKQLYRMPRFLRIIHQMVEAHGESITTLDNVTLKYTKVLGDFDALLKQYNIKMAPTLPDPDQMYCQVTFRDSNDEPTVRITFKLFNDTWMALLYDVL